MGHSQMLLAVAGLKDEEVKGRAERLASGDWSSFTLNEQIAFDFARRQSKTPWAIDRADWERLVTHLGKAGAIDLVLWASRCHYMTRVADAFQLPLERTNVFAR